VPKKYIIYVCPTGDLANQLSTYFTRSYEVCGPNSAHKYMPHCSLTGFFEFEDKDLDRWTTTIENVLSSMIPSMPGPPVHIMDMVFRKKIHCLELDSAWLRTLISKMISTASSHGIARNVKSKSWLHLSLAYGFREKDAHKLKHLAVDTICPRSSVEWNLRFYSRDESNQFECLFEQALV
jgi:hypothetical protein